LGFSFDQEGRTEQERDDLTKNSGGAIRFIPRRMFENFLLNPKAIFSVLSASDSERNPRLTENDVADWISANGKKEKYFPVDGKDWLREVNAVKLLQDLFNELSETRVAFDKLKHGVKITEWIINCSIGDFKELSNFIKELLQKRDLLEGKPEK
jgi:hypothetical protein